jgi:pilus assembly protein CpaB
MGRRALVLLVALLLAGVAAFAVYSYVDGIRTAVEEENEVRTVYRASEAVPEGQDGDVFINTELFVEGQDEVSDVPVGAISSEEELRAVITGRVAVGPISENEILTTDQWVELSVDITPLAEQIPSGKQALTISTDQVRGVNGFVQPGDRINAILTVDIEFSLLPQNAPGFGVPQEGGEGEGEEGEATDEESEIVTLSRYVLQGIPVLAVGRDVRPEEGERVDVADPTPVEGEEGAAAPEDTVEELPATVFTLEVDPEQAEKFVYAFENGSVWLTLVPEDFVEVDTNGITINNLFEGDLVDDIFGG